MGIVMVVIVCVGGGEVMDGGAGVIMEVWDLVG